MLGVSVTAESACAILRFSLPVQEVISKLFSWPIDGEKGHDGILACMFGRKNGNPWQSNGASALMAGQGAACHDLLPKSGGT